VARNGRATERIKVREDQGERGSVGPRRQPGGYEREINGRIPDDDAEEREREDVDTVPAVERRQHETAGQRTDQDTPA
jgi:hypothetical protein